MMVGALCYLGTIRVSSRAEQSLVLIFDHAWLEIDDVGGLIAECINVLRYKSSKGLGRVVVVQKARPIPTNQIPGSSANALKVRRGDVRHAVIVRTKKETQRPDGRVVKFDDNACVLLNNRKEPLGTRVNGVVSSELRDRGWGKILSLAPKVV